MIIYKNNIVKKKKWRDRMKYNYLKIAEIIKVKRLESGLSKRQLASLVGVSDTFVMS